MRIPFPPVNLWKYDSGLRNVKTPSVGVSRGFAFHWRKSAAPTRDGEGPGVTDGPFPRPCPRGVLRTPNECEAAECPPEHFREAWGDGGRCIPCAVPACPARPVALAPETWDPVFPPHTALRPAAGSHPPVPTCVHPETGAASPLGHLWALSHTSHCSSYSVCVALLPVLCVLGGEGGLRRRLFCSTPRQGTGLEL